MLSGASSYKRAYESKRTYESRPDYDAPNYEVKYRTRTVSFKFDEIIDEEIPEENANYVAFTTAQELGKNIILSIANKNKYKMKMHKSEEGKFISLQLGLPLYKKNSTEENKFNITVNNIIFEFSWCDILRNDDAVGKYNKSKIIVDLNDVFMEENDRKLFIFDLSLVNFKVNAPENKEGFQRDYYIYIYLMTLEGSSIYNVYKDETGKHFINRLDFLVPKEPKEKIVSKILQKPIVLPPPSIKESEVLAPKYEEQKDKFENQKDKYENIHDILIILGTMTASQVYKYKLTLLSKQDNVVATTKPHFDFETKIKTDSTTFKSYASALKCESQEEKEISIETDL
jgi:hypothetical protein